MRKAIGILACVTLAAGSLWLLSGGRPSRTASAQTENGGYESGARRLLQQARTLAEAGDVSQARRLARSAASFRVEWAPNEQTPEQFLQSLENVADTGTSLLPTEPAWEANGAIQQTGAVTSTEPAEGPNPFETEFEGMPPVQADAPSTTTQLPQSRKSQAVVLLRQARVALAQGEYEVARARALQARQLGVTFGLWDDRPEHVLAEIQRLTGEETIVGTSTETPSAPPVNTGNADQNRDTAIALLQAARRDLEAGSLSSARTKAEMAARYNVQFAPHEDSPELLMRDVQRLAGLAPASATAETAVVESKQQATSLLEQARVDLVEGRLNAAREKALAASKLNVTYGLNEDRPELILAEIQSELTSNEAGTPASPFELQNPLVTSTPAQDATPNTAMPVENAAPTAGTTPATAVSASDFAPMDTAPVAAANENPFAAEPVARTESPMEMEQAGNEFAPLPRRAPVSDFDVIHPEGETAVQAYERGLLALRQGNRVAARQAFLAAYRSGEQLDGFRRQQLQDFLRDLDTDTENAASNIVVAGGERTSPADAGDEFGGPIVFDQQNTAQDNTGEPSALQDVARQQAVRYDRLRTEVLNSVFRAERLKESNPAGAAEILDRSVANVEAAELTQEETDTLLRHLRHSQQAIATWQEDRAPLVELQQRNQEVKETIRAETETKVRIEQEYAKLVEEYNDLMDQRRYAEAEIVGKKAMELNPELPQSVVMVEKAKIARQVAINNEIREQRAAGVLEVLNDVEFSLMPSAKEIEYPKTWGDLTKRRERFGRVDGRNPTEKELQIEKSLERPISLHFADEPLADVIKHIAMTTAVDVVLDRRALEEEVVATDEPVTIDVDGIKLRSALNLLLEPYGLAYGIENEVLKITSRLRQDGEFQNRTYPVADLVIPLRNAIQSADPFSSVNQLNAIGGAGASFNVQDQLQVQTGHGLFQVMDDPMNGGGRGIPGMGGQGVTQSRPDVDFESLVDLIISTVEPGSWLESGGEGAIRGNESTLSLVIRQTSAVHDQIKDLLDQLRRLQDLQVTVEVRFISVTDRFFERIGVDFDFNVQDTLGDPPGVPPFGSRQLTFPGDQGQGGGGGGGGQQGDLRGGNQQGQGGAAGQQGQQQQGGTGLFDPITRVRPPRDDFSRTVVGLASPDAFTEDFDIGFRQGSFEIGVPDFGNFNPDAGIQVGMAILSDLEAFFFLQAAQADERANLLFAPKVTLFNGSSANIVDFVQRPFVIALVPVVGTGAVGFQPIIQIIPDGIQLNVSAVISADRRYVRLSMAPSFFNLVDVFTFSFASGGAGGGAGFGGGGFGGGGLGGGGFGGGGGGQFGFGGIGGGFGGGGAGGGFGGGGFGGGGAAGQAGQAGLGGLGGGTLTVQQPVLETISVGTTVSVPDGGTVLLGGIKRLREGRNMAGVPILNKIPYVSRLFKNSGVGRDTESVMLMVTPRIIIQEEEEELVLGTLVR